MQATTFDISGIILFVLFLLSAAGFGWLLSSRNRRSREKIDSRTSEVSSNSYRQRSIAEPTEASKLSNTLPLTAKHAVFLSYRRDDAMDITGRLYDRLSHDLGQSTIFKDIDSIPLGSDFRHHIDTSLRDCRVFLLVMGQRWAGHQPGNIERLADPRDFVRLEVETALRRNIPVVPILVHGARMPTENMLPPSLRDIAYRQAIHVRSDPDFHRDVERLTAFLKQQISTPV